MRNKNKEIVFSNGDPMKPVFCVDGKKYYTDKDVERLIDEYDDRLRVARGNFNLVETLNSFVERDLKKARRALWLARAYRGRDNSILLPSKFMRNVWDAVERKCRAKAEEYK